MQARLRGIVGLRRPESLRSRSTDHVRPIHCMGHASDLHRAWCNGIDRLALNIDTRNDSR